MGYKIKIVILLVCLSSFGCSQNNRSAGVPGQAEGSNIALIPLDLPATFTGKMPTCQGCQPVDITLNIRSDAIYQLRKTYPSGKGPGKVESQIGKWRYSLDSNLLILGKQKGLLKTYAVENRDTLRFVEWEGTDVQTQVQYKLKRNFEVDPFADVVKIRGMYSYDNDFASLTECSTGTIFPVGKKGEWDKTRQAYMNIPHQYGTPMLVSITGKLIKDGSGTEAADKEIIVIDQFKRFYPSKSCQGKQIISNLTETYWILTAIDGIDVQYQSTNMVPHLIFKADKTLAGAGGCNKIKGTYLVKGNVFLINREPSSRVACRKGVETENTFLKALDAAETYQLSGDILELIDQNGTTRARLKAGG